MQDGEELTEEFEEQAIQQAKEYGEQLSPDFACEYCARLDLQPPQDERLKEIAGWQIEDKGVPFFRTPPKPPTEDHRWFFSEEVFPAFQKSWRDHAADPEQCDICLDNDHECGHERHDPPCPVQ